MKKNNGIPVKTNLSSTQVLKTLSVLMQGNYTMTELIQKLNENEEYPVFNNSVVSKYINTCRFCGIKIPKIYNKYFLSNIPFCINLSDTEKELITYLQELANNTLSTKSKKEFTNFIKKLNNYSNEPIIKVGDELSDNLCESFEESAKCGHKIILMLKNKTELECTPISIEEYKGKIYFHVICKNKERMIFKGRVAGFRNSAERFVLPKKEENIIFTLYGNLAKNYNMREDETIIENNLPDFLTISNRKENHLLLLARLMRYGELCELQSPASVRTEMKNIINETLANYGEK